MPTSSQNEDSDELSVAGWVYADLLLALSIVALGATSFLVIAKNLPLDSESPASPTTPTTAPTTTVPEIQVANLSCDEVVFKFTRSELDKSGTALGRRFDAEVRRHASIYKLRDAKVGLMLLYGGYNSQAEQTKAGKKRADEIETQLRKASAQLRSVEARTFGASQITKGNEVLTVGGTNEFAIVAYLVYDGDPKYNGC
jgi:hypothetical protein